MDNKYQFGQFEFNAPIFHSIYSDITSDRKIITGASGTTKSTAALLDTLYWQVIHRGEPKIWSAGGKKVQGKKYVELRVGIVKRTIKDLQSTIHQEILKVFGAGRGINIISETYGESQPRGVLLKFENEGVEYVVDVEYRGVDLSRGTVEAAMYGWSPSILLVSEFNHLTADAIAFFILRTREGYHMKGNRPYLCFEGQAPSPNHALFMTHICPYYTKEELLDKQNWAGIIKQKKRNVKREVWDEHRHKKIVDDKIITTLYVMPSHVIDDKADMDGNARENPYAVRSPAFSNVHIANLVSAYRDDPNKYIEHLIGAPTYENAGNHYWNGFGHKNIDDVQPNKKYEIFVSTDADTKAVPLLWQYNTDTRQYVIIDSIGSRKDPQDMRVIGQQTAIRLRTRYKGYIVRPNIICDPSGASGTASVKTIAIIEEFNKGLVDEGMDFLKAKPLPYKYNKRSVRQGAVSRLCNIIAENGLPKFVINRHLTELVSDVTDYTWKYDDKGELVEPKTNEKFSTCDAVEYGAVNIMIENDEMNIPAKEYFEAKQRQEEADRELEEMEEEFYDGWGDKW